MGAFSRPALQQQASTELKTDPERNNVGRTKTDESLCAMRHMGGMTGQNVIARLADQYPDYIITH